MVEADITSITDLMNTLIRQAETIEALERRLNTLNSTQISHSDFITSNTQGIDTTWVAICTYLVFLMQTGFTLLEAGTARYKNYVSALIKNTLDLCISTLAWWILGYAFAFGTDKGGFIGASYFAGHDLNTYEDYNAWLFQWAFAGTAATIVSGCILERAKVWGYCLYASFMISWIYPLIVHWCWHSEGWLKDMGYIDFAGSGVVHMVGGTAGLFASIMIGSRSGRFIDSEDNLEITDKVVRNNIAKKEFRPTYIPFIVLGTLMLWFSWFGFNCGSTVTMVGDNTGLIGKIGMNTAISGAAGGLTCFIYNYILESCKGTDDYYKEIYSLPILCNGILAGLVGITAGCDAVSSWASLIIGVISAFIYLFYHWFLEKLKIDDPLDACPIHMGCGSWGVVAVGWFHTENGILYGHSGKTFGVNLLGIVVIFAWTAFWTILFFWLLKYINLQRITDEDEKDGMDLKYCGGYAVHYDSVSRRHYSLLFAPENRKKSILEIKQIEIVGESLNNHSKNQSQNSLHNNEKEPIKEKENYDTIPIETKNNDQDSRQNPKNQEIEIIDSKEKEEDNNREGRGVPLEI